MGTFKSWQENYNEDTFFPPHATAVRNLDDLFSADIIHVAVSLVLLILVI
jgi:hypothetical protein